MYNKNLLTLLCSISIVAFGSNTQIKAENASLSLQYQTERDSNAEKINKAEPLVLGVDTKGNAKYTSIQAAINAAQIGIVNGGEKMHHLAG